MNCLQWVFLLLFCLVCGVLFFGVFLMKTTNKNKRKTKVKSINWGFYLAHYLNNRLKASSKSDILKSFHRNNFENNLNLVPVLIFHQEIMGYFFIRINFVDYISALEKTVACFSLMGKNIEGNKINHITLCKITNVIICDYHMLLFIQQLLSPASCSAFSIKGKYSCVSLHLELQLSNHLTKSAQYLYPHTAEEKLKHKD